jgi:hypothetical protein
MEEFQYENISYSTININYNYGGEFFTLNLYQKDGVWIIHPFEGKLGSGNVNCSTIGCRKE